MNEIHPKPLVIQYDRASFRLLKAHLMETECRVKGRHHIPISEYDYHDQHLEIYEVDPSIHFPRIRPQGFLFDEAKKQLYQTFGEEMIRYLCYEKTLFNDSKLYMKSNNKEELDNKWIENMFSFIFNYGRPLEI